VIPKLSDEDLKSARRIAADARRQRSLFKQRIRQGELTLAQALDIALQDPVLSQMRVLDLLTSVHRVGVKKAGAIMERHVIAPGRRCRGLGHRQVAGLKSEIV
jgi:hypothetical protein